MTPISDLDTLLRSLEPVVNPGTFVYATSSDDSPLHHSKVIASIREPEGLSIIVGESVAEEAGLDAAFQCAWMTLNVNSDLAAIGLTAAFATVLGRAGISCNVVAGLNHDHIFVPARQAQPAMSELVALQQGARKFALA